MDMAPRSQCWNVEADRSSRLIFQKACSKFFLPGAPHTLWSDPDMWVTVSFRDMGNTLVPNGFPVGIGPTVAVPAEMRSEISGMIIPIGGRRI
jgi:hypothetical protein